MTLASSHLEDWVGVVQGEDALHGGRGAGLDLLPHVVRHRLEWSEAEKVRVR